MIGSSNTDLPFCSASRNAARAAISKASAGDVFLRHRAANDLGFEFESLARLVRFDHELDPRELTGTAGLLLVGVIDFRALGDPLAERHLRRADVGIDLVGALE